MSRQRVTAERCPICGKPVAENARPFCSPRCADVDLQRWFSGAYAIPVADDEHDAEDGAGPSVDLDSAGHPQYKPGSGEDDGTPR